MCCSARWMAGSLYLQKKCADPMPVTPSVLCGPPHRTGSGARARLPGQPLSRRFAVEEHPAGSHSHERHGVSRLGKPGIAADSAPRDRAQGARGGVFPGKGARASHPQFHRRRRSQHRHRGQRHLTQCSRANHDGLVLQGCHGSSPCRNISDYRRRHTRSGAQSDGTGR